jgi:hypothetical protein
VPCGSGASRTRRAWPSSGREYAENLPRRELPGDNDAREARRTQLAFPKAGSCVTPPRSLGCHVSIAARRGACLRSLLDQREHLPHARESKDPIDIASRIHYPERVTVCAVQRGDACEVEFASELDQAGFGLRSELDRESFGLDAYGAVVRPCERQGCSSRSKHRVETNQPPVGRLPFSTEALASDEQRPRATHHTPDGKPRWMKSR